MNDLLQSHAKRSSGSVECLGLTFPSEEARREHFLTLLAEKLKDTTFRKQDGFPQGTDEAILAMSDPPYYTACPNPWLPDFVAQTGTPYDPAKDYRREPMAIDVSIGKSDPVYKAHSYHTKVPHLAIVPSILHFTEPGDIVLDGFAGSGMTGIAAQWCGVASQTYRLQIESEWKKAGFGSPKWGARKAIINELSPAATSIAAGLNFPFDVSYFEARAKSMLTSVQKKLGWMFETKHTDGKSTGRIDFTVWSEVFTCSNCAGEIIFFDEAFDPDSKTVSKEIDCPHCSASATKENMDLVFETFLDTPKGTTERRPRRVPVLIKYAVGRRSFEKKPDSYDIDVIKRVEELGLAENLPTHTLPDCQMTRVGRMKTTNTTSIHHMYLPREAHVLSALWGEAQKEPDARIRNALKFWLDSHFTNMSILNRYRPEVSFPYNPLTGVFYVPSQIAEAEAKPELSALLEDNFLRYDASGDVPSQIHSYLSTNFKDLRGLEKDDARLKAKGKDRWYVPDPSKAKDLEQKRERSLLKEFEVYRSAPGRRLREFRLEVLRAGFKNAWAARDYKTIIGIGQKIPEEALQEDEKLLLWYDQALTRMEADA